MSGSRDGDERFTALVLRAARPQAERLAGFLEGKGFAVLIRPAYQGDASAQLEQALGETSPAAREVFETPVIGHVFRFSLKKEIGSVPRAELDRMLASTLPYDVLVAPEDLERALEAAGPKMAAEVARTTDPGDDPSGADDGPIRAVPVAELPWHQAWEVSERLTAAGIPAAVLMPEDPGQGRQLVDRVVPIGVKPEDADRARRFLAGPPSEEPVT